MKGEMAPHYAGRLSRTFWDRVNALPDDKHEAVYALGCALQELEGKTLRYLANAELSRELRKVKR